MSDRAQPQPPKIPPSSRPPRERPAPPTTGVPENPELRSQVPVRSGAIVMAVLWEE